MRIKVVAKTNIPGVQALIRRKGLDANGDVQRFHTNNVNNRIGKYMPHLSGMLETKLKLIKSPTEIIVLGPYAMMQYYGKVMIDPKINAAGFMTPEGWRSRRGSVKVRTDRDMEYTKTFNPKAGPYWDRALIASEGRVMEEDLRKYITRRRRGG